MRRTIIALLTKQSVYIQEVSNSNLPSAKHPIQHVEPVVGHVIALPALSVEAARERGAVWSAGGGLLVAVVPLDGAGGVRGVLNHRRVEGDEDGGVTVTFKGRSNNYT